MPKRKSRPLFYHDGFLFRSVKTLADGSELLYCDKRQTMGCTANAKRVNGVIFPRSEHIGHEADSDFASAKLARHAIREMATTTTCAPKELLKDVQAVIGFGPMPGSHQSLSKMIYRARATKPESAASTSKIKLDNMEESSQQPIDYNPIGATNIQEALQQFVKQEVEDDEEFEFEVDQQEPSPINDRMVIPTGDFFEILKNMIGETVKENNRGMVKEITSMVAIPSVSCSSQAPQHTSEDVSLQKFLIGLQSLASSSNSNELKQRTEAVIKKLNENKLKINIEDVLDATLHSLEQ